MPPAWSTMRIRSTPALRSWAPARTPAIPPPTITTSTSSVDRGPLGDGRERVLAVPGEVLVARQVPDVGAAGDQPLVALGQVLGVDGLGVETWTLVSDYPSPPETSSGRSVRTILPIALRGSCVDHDEALGHLVLGEVRLAVRRGRRPRRVASASTTATTRSPRRSSGMPSTAHGGDARAPRAAPARPRPGRRWRRRG